MPDFRQIRRAVWALPFLVPTFAAAAPKVVTDIAATHSIAAAVMGDVAAPTLIMPPGASPHDFAMRPSEAAALEDADLIFWIGEELTPWLGRAVETLGGGGVSVELIDAADVRRVPFRESAVFEVEDHAEDDHDDDGRKAHDDHADHGEHEIGRAHV